MDGLDKDTRNRYRVERNQGREASGAHEFCYCFSLNVWCVWLQRGARAVLLVDEDSEARAFPMVDSPMNSPSKRGLFNPQSNPLRSLAARPLSMEPAAHDSV